MFVCVEKIKVFCGSLVFNVIFIKGNIIFVFFLDVIVDFIILNCVINLVLYEEKNYVFKEMYCFLKFGGRVVVLDIFVKKFLLD